MPTIDRELQLTQASLPAAGRPRGAWDLPGCPAVGFSAFRSSFRSGGYPSSDAPGSRDACAQSYGSFPGLGLGEEPHGADVVSHLSGGVDAAVASLDAQEAARDPSEVSSSWRQCGDEESLSSDLHPGHHHLAEGRPACSRQARCWEWRGCSTRACSIVPRTASR